MGVAKSHVFAHHGRAQKEEKLELGLAKLQSTWSTIMWQTTPAVSRDIPMVKLSENDGELLEDNQVMVQVRSGAMVVP